MRYRIVWMLRALAFGIALLAAIDPAITIQRRARPTVSVIAVDPVEEQEHADSVSRVLSGTARVVRGSFAMADATVLVGDRLPESLQRGATPVFAVTDASDRAAVRLTRVDVPDRVPLHASTELRITVAVSAGGVARGVIPTGEESAREASSSPRASNHESTRTLTLTLRHGDALLDRQTYRLTGRDTILQPTLAFVPALPGGVPLRVEASISGATSASSGDASRTVASAVADAMVTVDERAWNVLVYDPRPSWMSTFVRRALERDPRFAVTSRIVTSRAISTTAGRAPATLDDPSTLAPFELIILGAPDALGERDINGVESFLRQRGGSVVLLFDTPARGATDRLTGVAGIADWSMHTSPTALPLRAPPFLASSRASVSATRAPLLATQVLSPVNLSAGAEARLVDAAGRSIVWQTSVGAGQLLVSGALDAWRFRDPDTSAFDRTWQQLIGNAAAASVPPLVVSVTPNVLAPTDSALVRVVLRDAALAYATEGRTADISTDVAAHLQWTERDSTRREPVRLWPDGAIGSLRGTLRLPQLGSPSDDAVPFDARLVVTADGGQSETAVRIDGARRHASAEGLDLLRRWTATHGGSVESMSTLLALADSIGAVVQAAPRAERWYPMRSRWWIIPFALALGAEWWSRRRRGLA